MQDITELQTRMEGALDRIAAGLAGLGSATAVSSSPLEGDLAAERELSANLQERLHTSRAEYEERIAAMEADLAETRGLLASVEQDRARLRAASDALRTTCERLRRAAAEEAADAELVNGAMQTEIDALGAARRSDREELDAIVTLLDEREERRHG